LPLVKIEDFLEREPARQPGVVWMAG